MMHPLLDDPFIAAQIEAAVAPYVGRLSAGEVAWMREQLAETLASDERAARLLRRARPVTVEESGEVRRDGAATVTPIQAVKGKAGQRG
ncbi:Hypothetical protein A7982_00293 [Minicystis rosea]|nr:Hypothetical protein A7982_00293 [Minicystis rosea]